MSQRIRTIERPASVGVPPATIPAAEWTATKSAISILQQGVTRKNLRSEGFAFDGSDEGAAVAAMVAADPAGTVYVIPDGATLTMGTTQLAITGKPHMRIEGYEGATMQWTSEIAGPLLRFTSSDHASIAGIAIVGGEAALNVTGMNLRRAVYFDGCDDASVADVRISNVGRGVYFDLCDRPTVEGFAYAGLASEYVTGVNYHTAIELRGGTDARITDVRTRDCGNSVLVGLSHHNGIISGVHARNQYDNPVYISSGNGWTVDHVHAIVDQTPARNFGTTTAVKMRGSGNTVMNSYAEGVGTGFTLTAYGDVDDAYGASSTDSAIINCEAYACRFGGALIDVYTDGSGTHYPRDFQIAGLRVRDCGQVGGTQQAIKILGGNRHTIRDCYIEGQLDNVAAINAAGTASLPLTGLRLIDNDIRNSAGGISAYAIQLFNVNDSVVRGTKLHDITTAQYGIRLFTCNNVLVTQTQVTGTVGTVANVRIHDAASTANRLILNPGVTISDLGTGTIKPQAYTVTNGLTDRAFDADTVTVAELADVVATLLADLKAQGVLA